jgi:hypothetical protein
LCRRSRKVRSFLVHGSQAYVISRALSNCIMLLTTTLY